MCIMLIGSIEVSVSVILSTEELTDVPDDARANS